MISESRFRHVLPVAETALAALCGGIGLWQRNHILSRRIWGEQTLWNSTAAFHVWPWPYKVAVIANIPAFFAGLLPSWAVEQFWPRIPETFEAAVTLLFVPLLWYWVGYNLDRRATASHSPGSRSTAWTFLVVFTLLSAVGAILPIGYVGFIPYGILVWIITLIWLIKQRKQIEKVT